MWRLEAERTSNSLGRERRRLGMRGGVVAGLSGVNNRWNVASASGPEAPTSLSGPDNAVRDGDDGGDVRGVNEGIGMMTQTRIMAPRALTSPPSPSSPTASSKSRMKDCSSVEARLRDGKLWRQ